LTPNKLDLSFPTPNDCAKFYQILFKIATAGAMTDRQTPAILLSVPCYAMGQTIIMFSRQQVSDRQQQ